MLVKFTFKNHKSFLGEQVLSLEASNDEMMQHNIERVSTALLPQSAGILRTGAIFGTTASGKTNVLKALDFMKRVVLMSATKVQIVRQVEPFAYLENSIDMDSHYEVEFIENGVYYRYGFVIRSRRIVREWLFRRTERLTPLFRRDEYGLKVMGLSKNGARLLAPSPSTLFLTVAGSLNLEINTAVQDVVSWFSKLTISLAAKRDDLFLLSQDEEYLPRVMDILRKAECGIGHARLIHEGGYIDIETTHRVYDSSGAATGTVSTRMFQDEDLYSDGTRTLVCDLVQVVRALDTGGTLFINDFANTLNVFLASYILSLFNSDAGNPHGAQLVITGNISALIDKAFRRDQIHFTTRDDDGQSHLVRLSSIPGVRKSDSYEKKLIENAHVNQYKLT